MADAVKVCSADLLTSLPRSWGLRATLEEGSRLLLDSLVSQGQRQREPGSGFGLILRGFQCLRPWGPSLLSLLPRRLQAPTSDLEMVTQLPALVQANFPE